MYPCYLMTKIQKMPKMSATAITLGQLVLPGRLPFSKPKVNWLLQEKTVKNTGGVAALQKMPKNYENTRQFVTGC